MRKNQTTERNIDCFFPVMEGIVQLMQEIQGISWFVRIFTSCTNLQSLKKTSLLIVYLLSELLL